MKSEKATPEKVAHEYIGYSAIDNDSSPEYECGEDPEYDTQMDSLHNSAATIPDHSNLLNTLQNSTIPSSSAPSNEYMETSSSNIDEDFGKERDLDNPMNSSPKTVNLTSNEFCQLESDMNESTLYTPALSKTFCLSSPYSKGHLPNTQDTPFSPDRSPSSNDDFSPLSINSLSDPLANDHLSNTQIKQLNPENNPHSDDDSLIPNLDETLQQIPNDNEGNRKNDTGVSSSSSDLSTAEIPDLPSYSATQMESPSSIVDTGSNIDDVHNINLPDIEAQIDSNNEEGRK